MQSNYKEMWKKKQTHFATVFNGACFLLIHPWKQSAFFSPLVKLPFTEPCQADAVSESCGLSIIINVNTDSHTNTSRELFSLYSPSHSPHSSPASTHWLYLTNTAGEFIPACHPRQEFIFPKQPPQHRQPWQHLLRGGLFMASALKVTTMSETRNSQDYCAAKFYEDDCSGLWK